MLLSDCRYSTPSPTSRQTLHPPTSSLLPAVLVRRIGACTETLRLLWRCACAQLSINLPVSVYSVTSVLPPAGSPRSSAPKNSDGLQMGSVTTSPVAYARANLPHSPTPSLLHSPTSPYPEYKSITCDFLTLGVWGRAPATNLLRALCLSAPLREIFPPHAHTTRSLRPLRSLRLNENLTLLPAVLARRRGACTETLRLLWRCACAHLSINLPVSVYLRNLRVATGRIPPLLGP